MTLWTALTKYNMELATKDEAKEIISALDLKPIETYAACVQRDYAKVMVEEKKPRRARPVVVETPVMEQVEQIIAEEVPAIIDHEVVKQENE